MPNQATISTKKIISPNLLPKEIKEEIYVQTIGESISFVGKIGIIFSIIFLGSSFLYLNKLKFNERDFSNKLSLETDSNKLNELKQINEESKKFNSLNVKIDQSTSKEYTWSGTFLELTKIMPEGVVLTNWEAITENPGWIRIRGVAKNRDVFLSFKNSLEKASFTESLESPLSNYVSPESLDFEIKLKLKDWKPLVPEKPKASEESASTEEN